tara:strand:- start:1254 stop:1430 length:177 start_codon:yes stop_codon:yes gene_type:complete
MIFLFQSILAIAFGELELSPLAYWSLFATIFIFIISFALSTIPLAKNMKKRKMEDNKE